MVERRIRVPGLDALKNSINSISVEIDSINERINAVKGEIIETIKIEKKDSPKVKLYNKKDELVEKKKIQGDRFRFLIEKKKELFNSWKKEKDFLVEEKKKLKLGNYAELDNREKEIKLEMQASKMTAQQEKKFVAELLEIKRKKKGYGALKEREEAFLVLDTEYKKINEELNTLKKDSTEIGNEISILKEKISEITEKTSKSEKVAQLEGSLVKLQKKKTELLEKKKKQVQEKKEKEDEYFKFKNELNRQLQIEKERKEMEEEIQKAEEEKRRILEEQAKINPHKFDLLRKELEESKNAPELVHSLSLILKLTEAGVSIPSTKGEIDSTLSQLLEKQHEFTANMEKENQSFKKKISETEEKIKIIKERISTVPPTNINLLKAEFNERN